jgi:eukaryotic-like serine/threonine-protein kinase
MGACDAALGEAANRPRFCSVNGARLCSHIYWSGLIVRCMAGHEPLVGGRYRLVEVIGEGGMGVVWRAADEVLGRDVAVKEVIFPVRLSAEDRELTCARSLREARSAARLSHPAVITVHDVIEHDDRPWIVMELFGAGSLADLLGAGALPPGRVAQIGLEVLGGLSAAHAAGVIHRDVKPSNVLVDGLRVVLTDFGAAVIAEDPVLTQTGLLIGTPAFLAPERARRGDTGPASDLWSLGATMYAAVEGRPPYRGGDSLAVLSALLTSDPEPHRQAGQLGPVLDGLLRADPAERMTAGQAAVMLGEIASRSRAAASTHPPTEISLPPRAQPGRPDVPWRPEPLAHDTATRTSQRPGQAAPHESVPSVPLQQAASGAPVAAHPGLRVRDAVAEYRTSTRLTLSSRELAGSAAIGGRPVEMTTIQATAGVNAVAFSPDSAFLALACDEGRALVVDLSGRERVQVRHSPGSPHIRDVAFSQAGSRLATAAEDRTARIWDAVTGSQLVQVTHTEAVLGVTFSPDGRLVATASQDKTARIWDAVTGSQLLQVAHEKAVLGVRFSPDGRVLATGVLDGTARILDARTGKQLLQVAHTGYVLAVAFSPDGKLLATGGFSCTVRIWDTATGSQLLQVVHHGAVEEIVFSPDGRLLATASRDGTARVWDAATGSELLEIAHTGYVLAVAFSPDGKLLATGSRDRTAQLWRLAEESYD